MVTTTLVQLIKDLDLLNEADTIYAKEPWSLDSEAIAAIEPDSGSMSVEIDGLDLPYFLEVAICREVLEGWEENRATKPSFDEECQRLIQYAKYDA